MMYDDKKELFTEIVKAGSRAYFLDVKENSKGDKYLIINERRDGKSQGNRIMVFPEHLESFQEGLARTAEFILREEKKKDK